jgi:hypothetical protein
MILYNIPPGLTTTIQLYVRNSDNTVGSAVGSTISGTSSGSTYTYTLGSYASGDYFAILTGVSDPVGSAFPVRDDVAFDNLTWSQLDMLTLVDAVVVANVTQPTAAKERLTDPIVIGDDYLASMGRNFEWQVNAIIGYAASQLSCTWTGSRNGTGWSVTGTVTTITGGLSLKFDLPDTATSSLKPGPYDWCVQVTTNVGGYVVTRVKPMNDAGEPIPVQLVKSA